MTSRVLKTLGALGGPLLGKNTMLDIIQDADGRSPLYAGFMLGDDYHVGLPSQGAPLTDLSGNGHTLTRTGATGSAGVKAKHAIGNGSNYWTTDFTTDQLSASGVVDQACLVAIGIFPSTGSEVHRLATSVDTAGANGGKYITLGANASPFDVRVDQHDGTSLTQILAGPATLDPARATDYFMFSANFDLGSICTRVSNASKLLVPLVGSAVSTAAGTRHVGGGVFRVATSNTNTFNLKLASMLFFDRELTVAELERIRSYMTDLLARYGVTL